jgi:hypothetical protein
MALRDGKEAAESLCGELGWTGTIGSSGLARSSGKLKVQQHLSQNLFGKNQESGEQGDQTPSPQC